MNKKEISELKKNFNGSSGYLTINSILTAYIDSDKTIRYINAEPAMNIPGDAFDMFTDTLKCVLSTNIGKNFVEYEFPNEAYEDGNAQSDLYKLYKNELADAEANRIFLSRVAENTEYDSPYSVITAYGTFTAVEKNSDDSADYNFLLTAICPANTGDDGLVFDGSTSELIKKAHKEYIIAKKPTDGFLYPTFSMRSADVNHICYYSKSASKPNISVIENVLECPFVMSADQERSAFNEIIERTLGDELTIPVISSINDRIAELAQLGEDETDIPMLGVDEIYSVLDDIGTPQKLLDELEDIYKDVALDAKLTAVNLLDSKTMINLEGISISVKPSAQERLRTAILNGKKCIVIDLDDEAMTVNGLQITA
jgi:hypothetical protein